MTNNIFILISTHAPISAHPSHFQKKSAYAHIAQVAGLYFTPILLINIKLKLTNLK